MRSVCRHRQRREWRALRGQLIGDRTVAKPCSRAGLRLPSSFCCALECVSAPALACSGAGGGAEPRAQRQITALGRCDRLRSTDCARCSAALSWCFAVLHALAAVSCAPLVPTVPTPRWSGGKRGQERGMEGVRGGSGRVALGGLGGAAAGGALLSVRRDPMLAALRRRAEIDPARQPEEGMDNRQVETPTNRRMYLPPLSRVLNHSASRVADSLFSRGFRLLYDAIKAITLCKCAQTLCIELVHRNPWFHPAVLFLVSRSSGPRRCQSPRLAPPRLPRAAGWGTVPPLSPLCAPPPRLSSPPPPPAASVPPLSGQCLTVQPPPRCSALLCAGRNEERRECDAEHQRRNKHSRAEHSGQKTKRWTGTPRRRRRWRGPQQQQHRPTVRRQPRSRGQQTSEAETLTRRMCDR